MFKTSTISILFIILNGCGNKSSIEEEAPLIGPVFSGSSYEGTYITMTALDSTSSSSSLFWYDFANGSLSKVSSADGRDPISIWNSSTKTLTFASRGNLYFRTFKISDNQATDTKSGTLTGLDSGDPTDWADLGAEGILFANLHDRSLRIFDPSTGYLEEAIDSSNLDTSSTGNFFAPNTLYGTQSTAWTLTTSVDFSAVNPTASGFGAAFHFVKSESKWSPKSNTGVSLPASHPSYSQLTSSGTLRIFGLCAKSFGSQCKAGAGDLNLSTSTVSLLADFTTFDYEYYSTIVAGPNEDTVYAHVMSTSSKTYKVARIDLKTKKVKEIADVPDSGLYLLSYDASSDRLLLGSKENGVGVLSIYKAETLESTVKTYMIPWQSSFVSKN